MADEFADAAHCGTERPSACEAVQRTNEYRLHWSDACALVELDASEHSFWKLAACAIGSSQWKRCENSFPDPSQTARSFPALLSDGRQARTQGVT